MLVQNRQYDFAGPMVSLCSTGQSVNQCWAGQNEWFVDVDSYTTETMSYNAMGQTTSLSWSGSAGLTGGIAYTYSATQNNGQITGWRIRCRARRWYQYDALKRLTSASSTPTSGITPAAWAENFQYDGFGNLTAKVLNGTTTSIAVNAATNRLTNATYDLNGNMTSGPGLSLAYDEANRVMSATEYVGRDGVLRVCAG